MTTVPRKAATTGDPTSLIALIAALERELARYAASYGATDEVRRLFRSAHGLGAGETRARPDGT